VGLFYTAPEPTRGLLLGWATFWAITQLLEHHHPNRAKRRQCCVTDRTTFHCKYKEPTELRTDYRSTAAWHDISKVHRKRPDSLSLPHCPSQRGRRLKDCYKAYHITRSSALRQTDPRYTASVEILSTTAQL